MTNATAFVTGASRGLGEAIVRSLLKAGFTDIVAVSRSGNASLDESAAESGAHIEWLKADLGDATVAANTLGPVFDRYRSERRNPVVLINNAGVVEPVGPVGTVDPEKSAQNIQVNLTAPILLCNEFLRAFGTSQERRVIVNVTSGLARRPMTGVACYSAAKAGVDMLTKALALEKAQSAGGEHKASVPEIYAISPGTVATDMQATLRSATDSELPDRSTFVSLFEQGELYSPEYSSSKIVDLIMHPRIDSGSVVHVRDL